MGTPCPPSRRKRTRPLSRGYGGHGVPTLHGYAVNKIHVMKDALPEYADEYTFAERVRYLAFGIIAATCVMLVTKWWFLPWLKIFSESAHCRTVLGLPGLTVLFYGVFVGMPLFFFLICSATFMPQARRILRSNQYPPPGQKTLRRTRVFRGARARWHAYAMMACCVVFLVFAAWGFPQAKAFLKEGKPAVCAGSQ